MNPPSFLKTKRLCMNLFKCLERTEIKDIGSLCSKSKYFFSWCKLIVAAWNVFFLMVLVCKKQKNLVCHFHSPFFLRKIIRYIQGTFLLLQQVRDQEKLPILSVPFIHFLASSIQFFLNNFLALGVIFWELCQRCMQYWTYSISQSLQHAEKEKSNQKHHWSKTLDFIEANMYK